MIRSMHDNVRQSAKEQVQKDDAFCTWADALKYDFGSSYSEKQMVLGFTMNQYLPNFKNTLMILN